MDNVVGATPDNFLAFDLVFGDVFLQDIGGEIEVPVLFDFLHENIVAAWRGHVT
jgi:hypothetical protein